MYHRLLEDITFLTLHISTREWLVYVFVHLFASGFKGSTGSVVQEKSTEDKLTQVSSLLFSML